MGTHRLVSAAGLLAAILTLVVPVGHAQVAFRVGGAGASASFGGQPSRGSAPPRRSGFGERRRGWGWARTSRVNPTLPRTRSPSARPRALRTVEPTAPSVGPPVPGYAALVGDYRAARRKAERAFEAGRFHEAEAFYADAARRAEDFYGETSGPARQAQRNRARAARAAEEQLRRLQLASAPASGPAGATSRGEAAMAAGRFREAVREFAEALEWAIRRHGPDARPVRRASRRLGEARSALLGGASARLVD